MWIPDLDGASATLSGRLVEALARDIAAGRLDAGHRLPTHRDLAQRLGIGIGTVTSAYAEAARRGLIEARVGSGSYVAGPAATTREDATIMLSHNIPPLEPSQRRLAATLARLRRRPDLLDALGYAPPPGLPSHRRAAAEWLARHGGPDGVDAERLIVTAGAQQAMALAFQALCAPGDTVLVEAATFFGARTLAQHAGYRLVGVAMDDEGMLPDALDRAAAGGARVLYIVPTLQNPTGRIMSAARRQDIAAIARRRDMFIIEDDVYGSFAGEAAPPPLTGFAPERSFYLSGLSKTVAPGLRTGFLVAPDGPWFERLVAAIRAQSYAPPTLGGLVAAQWIEDGTADAIAAEIAAEVEARTALAVDRLGDRLGPIYSARCPHLWLPMPELDAERLVARALRAGVQLTPASAPIVDPALITGVRLCVGASRSRAELETALHRLQLILAAPQKEPTMDLV
ncbi:PLP-dependent aminotransferase family protein [Sphingomonas quercus]|uniref:PLP-dependent aminotransferase family protein n=1 Tax=Sphingomonas quercus TaxID=2842451 RepID=A0ABS6BDP6_9SPHN|nr:PLP-dependent aminotransferase family protein [Sphingomonas quercus]MBU3076438.1 PLP-dependent aminotransferase family protein [Sphingomonas quercus]